MSSKLEKVFLPSEEVTRDVTIALKSIIDIYECLVSDENRSLDKVTLRHKDREAAIKINEIISVWLRQTWRYPVIEIDRSSDCFFLIHDSAHNVIFILQEINEIINSDSYNCWFSSESDAIIESKRLFLEEPLTRIFSFILSAPIPQHDGDLYYSIILMTLHYFILGMRCIYDDIESGIKNGDSLETHRSNLNTFVISALQTCFDIYRKYGTVTILIKCLEFYTRYCRCCTTSQYLQLLQLDCGTYRIADDLIDELVECTEIRLSTYFTLYSDSSEISNEFLFQIFDFLEAVSKMRNSLTLINIENLFESIEGRLFHPNFSSLYFSLPRNGAFYLTEFFPYKLKCLDGRDGHSRSTLDSLLELIEFVSSFDSFASLDNFSALLQCCSLILFRILNSRYFERFYIYTDSESKLQIISILATLFGASRKRLPLSMHSQIVLACRPDFILLHNLMEEAVLFGSEFDVESVSFLLHCCFPSSVDLPTFNNIINPNSCSNKISDSFFCSIKSLAGTLGTMESVNWIISSHQNLRCFKIFILQLLTFLATHCYQKEYLIAFSSKLIDFIVESF